MGKTTYKRKHLSWGPSFRVLWSMTNIGGSLTAGRQAWHIFITSRWQTELTGNDAGFEITDPAPIAQFP